MKMRIEYTNYSDGTTCRIREGYFTIRQFKNEDNHMQIDLVYLSALSSRKTTTKESWTYKQGDDVVIDLMVVR